MAYNHSHGHAHGGEGNIGAAFFLNLSFAVIELIGGALTNSVAIISDAFHDFGDSLSLGLAWYFQKLSKKGVTTRYTYGYKRFSLLGAVINAAILIAGSAYVLTRAIPRLAAPQETGAAGMFILSIIGIVINGIAVLRTRKASSLNERVVSLHLLEDVLGWTAVLIGSVIMRFTGLMIIDPILSVAIAGFVLFNAFKNVGQALRILLQGVPAEIDRERIIDKLKKISGVSDTHDFHIWSLDEEHSVLTVHVILEEAMTMAELAGMKSVMRSVLREEGVWHATIEFETADETCGFVKCGAVGPDERDGSPNL